MSLLDRLRRLFLTRRFFRASSRSAITVRRKNHLPDFYLVAFLNQNLVDRPAYRRRHFYHRLIGFEFHHRLALAHRRSRRNHQAYQVALFNVFAKRWEFEFDH